MLDWMGLQTREALFFSPIAQLLLRKSQQGTDGFPLYSVACLPTQQAHYRVKVGKALSRIDHPHGDQWQLNLADNATLHSEHREPALCKLPPAGMFKETHSAGN